jgi:large subunit ribosomal protein L24
MTRRVVVQGVNIRTKHQRQVQTQANRNVNPGGFSSKDRSHLERDAGLPKCKEPTRVGIKRDDEGAHRVCKKKIASHDRLAAE